jgi:cell division protein FtsX
MSIMTEFYFRRALPVLRRNPVLTAMMVYSVGMCIALALAVLALWRVTERPYVVPPESPNAQVIHIRALL